jgi:hypothetical protein
MTSKLEAEMNYIHRMLRLTAWLSCLLLNGHTALAAEETYLREYTYQASEADSKITARAIALQEVKRILLSELGTHVSSLVKLQADSSGKRLGTEQIETLSAGVTRVEILAEKWDGGTYVLKAQIKADPAEVLRSLEKMLDADKKQKQVSQLGGELDKVRGENIQIAASLAQSRKDADAAMIEIIHLKQQLKQQQTDTQREALQTQYQQQAQQLTLQELFDAGWKKHQEGNDAEAAALWREAAKQNHVGAQANLGVMYAQGDGVPQDDKQAVFWTRQAAEQGYAQAQNNLGIMYYMGKRVPQNATQAFSWFQKAAEQGHADAQYYLGMMYFSGKGIPKNPKQAVSWFHKAAEQGDADAEFALGMSYVTSQGVPQNFKQATLWFRKASEHGNAQASEILRQREGR